MKFSIAPLLTSLGVIVTLQSVVCCSPSYTINSPSGMQLLPENEGVNGGSFIAVTDWKYRGSDEEYHYFWHFHNKGNHLRKCSVRIQLDSAKLDLSSHPVSDSETWVKLQRDDTSNLHFVYTEEQVSTKAKE